MGVLMKKIRTLFISCRPFIFSTLIGLFKQIPLSLIITSFFSLILMSCSSIYTEKNFSSKEKLYQNFNNSAKGTPVDVTFINDSSVIFQNGALIENDTLYAYKYLFNIQKGKVNLSEIQKIDYTGNDYNSAVLFLKNGKRINAENIKTENNTMKFSIIDKVKARQNVAALSLLKKASYKNRWLGLLPGSIVGTVLGFIGGAILYSILISKEKHDNLTKAYISLLMVPIGAVAGLIWGWISGYNYTYKFNQ